MASNKLLKFSSSPHVKAKRTTRHIMIDVCIALLPAVIMGIVYFGWRAAALIAISVASSILSEGVYLLICKKTIKEIIHQFDFTSCVTGLLIALSIGSQTPLYVPVLASIFAIIVVKMLFGGTGKNLVNPAVTGRVFAFISFTSVMASGWLAPSISSIAGGWATSISPTTGATILTEKLSGAVTSFSVWDMLLGTGMAGCIGETCKLALIVGAIYLAVRRVINIIYPAIYIAVTGVVAVILQSVTKGQLDLYSFFPAVLSGGLFLGAFFMATDYTTSPNTTVGNIVYFALLGILTAVLRWATGIEVVSFVILLGNLLVPLIDKFIVNKPFGYVKVKKVKEKKNG